MQQAIQWIILFHAGAECNGNDESLSAHSCCVICWAGTYYEREHKSEHKQMNVRQKRDNRADVSENGSRWSRFELNI